MASSTLDREKKPPTDKGHGSEVLGPGGNSDSGGAVADIAPDAAAGQDVEDTQTPARGPDEVRKYPSRRRRRSK